MVHLLRRCIEDLCRNGAEPEVKNNKQPGCNLVNLVIACPASSKCHAGQVIDRI